MKIAIHCSELNQKRVDGTRVYLASLLNHFSQLNPEDDFLLYHKGKFNLKLKPLKAKNYAFKKLNSFPFWTQTKFAWEVFKDKPDVLWMPVHNLPFLQRKSMKTFVTAHDLAFKLFPETFSKKDLLKLNLLADYSFQKTDKIIAVSQATKNDLLRFYPKIKEENVRVIYHGVDLGFWQAELDESEVKTVLNQYNLKKGSYIISVGAIQPRKNLFLLIEVFEKIKHNFPDLKLVLAGGYGWLFEGILKRVKESNFSSDIILTNSISFELMRILLRNAKVAVYPSLYEGFGIPVLESMASGVPTVCARNSSFIEIGGEAAIFFETNSSEECQEKVEKILLNKVLQEELSKKGLQRVENFSWEKCAKETLDFLKT